MLSLMILINLASTPSIDETPRRPLVATEATKPSVTQLQQGGGLKRSLVSAKTTVADVGMRVTLTGATIALFIPVTAFLTVLPLALFYTPLFGLAAIELPAKAFVLMFMFPGVQWMGIVGAVIAVVGSGIWLAGAITDVTSNQKLRDEKKAALRMTEEKSRLQSPRVALPVDASFATYTFSF